ncbi:MAG: hypothetical protein FWF95_03710 [Syntrophorhabdaceae bacterium]|nr:hypothetical protein [Syntrophorhabdaceae bacterium]
MAKARNRVATRVREDERAYPKEKPPCYVRSARRTMTDDGQALSHSASLGRDVDSEAEGKGMSGKRAQRRVS